MVQSPTNSLHLSPKTYGLNQLRYDLRKLKGHGLLQRDGRRYAYRLTRKGVDVTLLFLFFHKRLCGPLANSRFYHKPDPASRPNSRLEAAYHKADRDMVAPVEALAAIPDTLSAVEAAPLLCAGINTYNSLRHSGALPGDLVAVQGIGGLGHLGIQFANKFGYKVAAIGRGSENAALAKKLGASLYIDSKATNAAQELQKWAAPR